MAAPQVGFKMFLGINVEVRSTARARRGARAEVAPAPPQVVPGSSEREFSLQLGENPLAEFVELPDEYSKLEYSNLLCGVLRGALEMVQMRVECSLVKDVLWGDEVTEIRVVLKEMLEEEYHDDE
jgi:hypothetical protein